MTNFISKLETEIAELLVAKLEREEITLERASQIARFVLDSLPESISEEEVKNLIPKLDNEFYELSDIVYNHMMESGVYDKREINTEAEELKKRNELQKAENLLKSYFKKKLKENE